MAYYLYKSLGNKQVRRHEPLTGETWTGPTSAVDRFDHPSHVIDLPFKSSSYGRQEKELATARSHAIPISPADGLYLEPTGHGNERRFAKLFAEAWREFPQCYRELLVEFWALDCPHRVEAETENFGGTGKFNLLIPRIQLIDRFNDLDLDDHGWLTASGDTPSPERVKKAQEAFANHLRTDSSLDLPKPDNAVVFGEMGLQGFLFQFTAKFVDKMPDHAVQYLVTHELAHAVLSASPTHGEVMGGEEEERLVDEMLEHMGYPERAMFEHSMQRHVLGAANGGKIRMSVTAQAQPESSRYEPRIENRILIARAHKLPNAPAVPPKPVPPAPDAKQFMGEVPNGHTLVAQSTSRGIRVAKDAEGRHTTLFAPGSPEMAAKRIGPSVFQSMCELALSHERFHHFNPVTDDDLIPVGLIAEEVRYEHPGTSDGEVLAALEHLRSQGHIVGRHLHDHDRLVSNPAEYPLYPLKGGGNLYLSSLFNCGLCHHHFTFPEKKPAG